MFTTYNRLNKRQETIRFLPMDILKRMNFQLINYDNEIHAAKRNAAEYFYALGLKNLDENNRLSAQKAYHNFKKIKSYYPNYKDVDQLIIQAENKGTTNILFR